MHMWVDSFKETSCAWLNIFCCANAFYCGSVDPKGTLLLPLSFSYFMDARSAGLVLWMALSTKPSSLYFC